MFFSFFPSDCARVYLYIIYFFFFFFFLLRATTTTIPVHGIEKIYTMTSQFMSFLCSTMKHSKRQHYSKKSKPYTDQLHTWFPEHFSFFYILFSFAFLYRAGRQIYARSYDIYILYYIQGIYRANIISCYKNIIGKDIGKLYNPRRFLRHKILIILYILHGIQCSRLWRVINITIIVYTQTEK